MDTNVASRIDDFLDQAFEAHDDSPAVADLRIELRHDLLERLTDLLDQGMGDELAYAQTIASVGDIGATIQELVIQDQTYARQGVTPSEPAANRPADDHTNAATGSPSLPVTPLTSTEPTGPAEQLAPNEATAPGATWNGDQSAGHRSYTPGSSETPSEPGTAPGSEHPGATHYDGTTNPDNQTEPDWLSRVSQMVNAGLETARDQIVSAIQQADDALTKTDWEARVRQALTVDQIWVRGFHQAERKARTSYAASDLRGTDFSGLDLPGKSFAASSLRGARFVDATLVGAGFAASDLREVDFSQADLTGANLATASLRNARFERTNLTGATLSHASLRQVDFTGAVLRGTKAKYADLRDAQFRDCLIEQADFTGADLRDASFDGIVLTDVRFDMANLAGASFDGATLRGVSFRHISSKSLATLASQNMIVDPTAYSWLIGHLPPNHAIRVEE